MPEHPEGCSLRLFYLRLSPPCKERGSARSAKTTNPVRNVALPVPVGSKSVAVTICCMGKIIFAEHSESVPYGCSIYVYPHPVRNAALPVPFWGRLSCRCTLLYGGIFFRGTLRECSLRLLLFILLYLNFPSDRIGFYVIPCFIIVFLISYYVVIKRFVPNLQFRIQLVYLFRRI